MNYFDKIKLDSLNGCLTAIPYEHLKQELGGTRPYKETSAEENSVINDHCSLSPIKFSVNAKDRQDKLPTMYWLPKLHKNI